jgi:hypothetical protein
VLAVAVSEDGGTIVAGFAGGRINVFGRQNNASIWSYNTGANVFSVAVSSDGSTIVAGGGDGKIHVFGRQSNATIWSYNTGDGVASVAVSSDGSTIVAGGWDYQIHVFGRQSNATLWSFLTPGFFVVWSVAVSAGGNTIAAGSQDAYLRVFGRNSNTTLWNYVSVTTVAGVAVSRDGTTISAGDGNGNFRVFSRASNVPLLAFTGGQISNVVAISSDGSITAFGSNNGADSRAYLFSKTLGLLWDYRVPNDIVTDFGPGVGISGDGSLIAYGCYDNKLYVFQYDSFAPLLGTPSVAPASPVGGQSVTISVSATDNLGISTVTMHIWNATAGSWSSILMSPVGAAYKATVGPFTSGDVVSYYVSATDTSGNDATSPANAPLTYYTLTIGSSTGGAPVSEWNITTLLIGAGLGALIAIVAVLLMTRGKKSRK